MVPVAVGDGCSDGPVVVAAGVAYAEVDLVYGIIVSPQCPSSSFTILANKKVPNFRRAIP